MQSELAEWAGSRGYRAVWYGVSAVNRAVEAITRLRDQRAFDDVFYERSLSWVCGSELPVLPAEKSVVVVAVPRPAHVATFDYRGQSVDLILPPTYHNYSGLPNEVKKDLESFLGNGASLRAVKAPLKGVAARTGLVRYGRNNITYVDGMGSYAQLMAFASHMSLAPSSNPDSVEPSALDQCRTCKACYTACPTGAISADRFLVHAHRCVTWQSEYEGPLPDAFGAAKRPCLVGCMVCQEVCPVNRGLLRFEHLGVHFTQDETELLLGEGAGSALTPETCARIEALRCSDCTVTSGRPASTFRRNLDAVLKHRRSSVPLKADCI